MRRIIASTAAAVAALSALVAGCGVGKAGAPVDPGRPVAVTSAGSSQVAGTASASPSSSGGLCPSTEQIWATPPKSPTLPDGFEPVAVVVCEIDERIFEGDREWYVVVQRQAVSGIDRLVRLLRQPRDEKLPPQTLCAVAYEFPPWVALVGADGRWVRRHVPEDGCGRVTDRFNKAVDAARWTTIGERRDTPVRSDDELRAEGLGCDYESGDPASIPLFFAPTSTGIAAIDGPTTRLTVCRYAVTPDSDGVLVFQSGGPVPPETGAALARELAATEPGRRCPSETTRTATIRGEDGTDRLTVQLDGCRLVFDATGGWGQATPGLIDVLG